MSKKNVEWEWKKLGDVCEVIAGQSPKGSSYNNNEEGMEFHQGKKSFGKTIIESSGVWTSEITKIASPEDILISVRAPVGPVNFTDRQLCIGRGLAAIRAKHVDKKYLYLFLVYNESNMASKTGAVFDSISRNDIINFDIPIPPLDEQERIVKVLDDAFEKIDVIKTTAETNLQNAKDLFQTTLANELSITDEKIKQGWEERTLENTCELMCGYAFDSKGYSIHSKDTLLICGDNIVNCDFRWDTEKRWPKEKCPELKRFELRLNDIVLAMDRPWVKSGLKIAKVSERELPSLLVQRTACLRAHQKLSQDFLYFCLQNAPFSSYLTGNQTGGGVPHISGKQILAYTIPLPPLPIQKQIVAKLDSLSEKVKQLESNYKQVLADCDELKKALLKQAFEGML